MQNQTLNKTFDAEGTINPYRICKFGAADYGVVQGAANTDLLFAVSGQLGAVSGERIDLVVAGMTNVEYGGNVTRGQPLTSDANGKAVNAIGTAGARIIGYAVVSGVDGDIGSMVIDRGQGHA